LDKGSPERPADFTLEETLAIIGEGGGNKALASLLAEDARNKDALEIRPEIGVTRCYVTQRKKLLGGINVKNSISTFKGQVKGQLIYINLYNPLTRIIKYLL
jgi:hypothetical protein